MSSLLKKTLNTSTLFRHIRYLIQLGLLTGIYFIAAYIGFQFATYNQVVTLIWPATGVAIASLVLWGYRYWPAVALGAFLINASSEAPLTFAASTAVGNTLEALLGAYLWGHYVNIHNPKREESLSILGMVGSTAVSVIVSATIGTVGMVVNQMIDWGSFLAVWQIWWLGDFMSALIVTSLLLVWLRLPHPRWHRREKATFILALVLISIFCLLIFTDTFSIPIGLALLAYTVIPLSLWAAYQYGPHGATAVTFLAVTFAVWGTANQNGPLVMQEQQGSFILLSAYINVLAIITLLVATTIYRYQQMEEILFLTRYSVNNAAEGMFQITSDARIVYANDTACQRLGYTYDELLQMKIHDIDPTYSAGAWTQDWQAIKENKHLLLETVNQTKSGHIFPVEISSSYFEYQGQEYCCAFIRDIAPRKDAEQALRESEEKYRNLVESSLQGVMIVQGNRLVFVNKTGSQMLGYTQEELLQMSSKALSQLIHPDSQQTAMKMIKATMSAKNVSTEQDIRIFHRDGTVHWFRLLLNPIEYQQEPAILASGFDITEQKQTEEVLRQTQKMESLGVLAGGIAHDFNNLLVAMIGQTSLALNKLSTDSVARQHIEKSKKAAERASDLTRQLLTYSGRGQFERKSIGLNALIRENTALFEIAIPQNVHIETNLFAEPLWIKGDMGQLQQVIMNLIINGAEAIGEQPGKVTISTTLYKIEDEPLHQWLCTGDPLAPGTYIQLTVTDNGCGMDKETISRIFDPFFSTKFTGRGLGLAAVLGIMRTQNGALSVASEVGQGTTFKLLFPPAEPAESVLAPTAVHVNYGHKACILVIDDEAFVREAVKDILNSEEINVLLAEDGETGLQLYQTNQSKIHLVLLDLSMPGLSGEETLSHLQHLNPYVRVLLSSGYSEKDITTRIQQANVLGFLQKPYDYATLVTAVNQYLEPD